MKPDSNVKQVVPFFGVADMQVSLHFYVDGLGFEMTKKWIDGGKVRWCWLEIGDAAIMLQEYRNEGHDSFIPTSKVGVGVNTSFQCLDVLAIYHAARQRGLQPTRPFVGNGMWVTTLYDPDGYRIEFESPTDVPEDTEYNA